MKTSFTLTVAAASMLLTAGPASAYDVGTPSWTGIYVSAGLGVGSANSELSIGPGPLLPPNLFNFNFDGIGGEGALGTIGLGFDYQVSPRFVVGVFFDYDFANIETDLDIGLLGLITANGKFDIERQWSIGTRVGVLASPSTLWYALGGYTQVETSDLSVSVAVGGAPIGGISIGVPSFSGWFVGGGVETMLAPNWSLKAEYRYTQLDDERLDFSAISPVVNNIIDARLEPSIHTARVAVSYKFNWDHRTTVEPLK